MKPESKALEIEILISELLRWGVRASLALLALGTVLCFVNGTAYGTAGGSAQDLHRLITAEEAFPRSIEWLLTGLIHLQGQAIVVTGLLLLISTPVVRVLVSVVAFAIEKDKSYVIITLTVFALLLLSFALGKAG